MRASLRRLIEHLRGGSLTAAASMTLAQSTGSMLISVVFVVVVARVLAPESNGAHHLALLLPTLLMTFFNAGLPSATVCFVGASRCSRAMAIAVNLRAGALLAWAGIVCGWALVQLWGDRIFPGVSISLLLTALLVYPVMLARMLALGLLQSLEDFRWYNISSLLLPAGSLLSLPLFIAWGGVTPFMTVAAFATGNALSCAAALWRIALGSTHASNERLELREVAAMSARFIRFGLKSLASNVLTFINYRADLLLVNILIAPLAAGIYVAAIQIAEKLWLLSQAVATVVLPRMARLQQNPHASDVVTVRACQWTTMLTLIGAGLIAGVAPLFVPLLFGKAYADAVAPLIWLMPGIVALAGGRILANAITAAGRPHLNAYVAVSTLIVNVVMNLLLIPVLGLRGAALATTVAYLCDTGVKGAIYASMSGGRWWRPFIISASEVNLRWKATRAQS
ncbi:MAG TPA: oligosaccharide flippase family protein [Steroidobacter sp.]|nr:oligosaccharide flippase family protein [Steroidobacter sp.]